MKRTGSWLALASLLWASRCPAVSFNDIEFWTGSGTNRAALVVAWTTPESSIGSTVPAPVADKSLVWGYRFNGTAAGSQMLKAIVAADPRFYAVERIDPVYGTGVYGIGFHLAGGADLGITDGSVTNYFTNGILTNATVDVDAAMPLNPGDLYWGGLYGPNWETWNERGDTGGLFHSPDRGPNPYWTPDDPQIPYSGVHGQWEYAQTGLDGLQLTNGSWIGFSVAAGEFEFDPSAPYNAHKHAPASPDAGVTALVKNLKGGFHSGQWQVQFLSCSNWLYSLERSPDMENWASAASAVAGNGTTVVIADPAPPATHSFYRIRADQP